MRHKIFKEALDWYQNKNKESEVNIQDFVNLIIDRTADSIFNKVNDELIDEFKNGNLKHPFIISSEYYLDLKLKDIKQKCVNKTEYDVLVEKQEIKEEKEEE